MIPDLNKEQKEAVTAPLDKHILVTAGAGTGKTRVLAERIIHLINGKNVPPEKILALTFTKFAANEMLKRVISRLSSYHKKPFFIGTIHDFFTVYLRKIIGEDGNRKYDFDLIEGIEIEKYLKKAIGKINPYLPKGKLSIKDTVIPLLSKWRIEKFFNKKLLTDPQRETYGEVFEEYEKILEEKNSVDFDLVLISSLEIIRNNEEKRDEIGNLFSHVLVDECQDLNEVQWQLIIEFLGKNQKNSVFMVGDPNQCIYRFNGAKDDLFPDARKLFGENLEEIVLVINYRSDIEIVNHSKGLMSIKTAYPVANSQEKGLVKEVGSIEEIDGFLKEPLENWVILVRNYTEAKDMINWLIENEIPFKAGRFYLLESTNIKIINNLLRVIFFDNSKPLIDLISLLNLDKNTQREITSYNNLPLKTTFFDYYINGDEWKESLQIPKESIEKLSDLFKEINLLREKDRSNLMQLIQDCWDFLGKLKKINKAETEKIDLFKKWIKPKTKELGAEEIVLELNAIAEFSKEEIRNDEFKGLILSSIHKVKGLEWDNVVILEYDELLSSFNSKDEDDKNLAYVAVTRAKNKLFLLKK